MRFIMLYRPGVESDAPPSIDEMTKMGEFIQEMSSKGVLLAADGLQVSSKGARVRISNGDFTVTDGPFTETKELIAGFAIVESKSMDEAKYWAKRFLSIVGQGESEVR